MPAKVDLFRLRMGETEKADSLPVSGNWSGMECIDHVDTCSVMDTALHIIGFLSSLLTDYCKGMQAGTLYHNLDRMKFWLTGRGRNAKMKGGDGNSKDLGMTVARDAILHGCSSNLK